MKQDNLVTNDKQAMQALKQHGGNIVTAILVVLAVFFGWQWYQKKYAKIDTQAADMYTAIGVKNEQLTVAKQNPNADTKALVDSLNQDIDKLVATHGKTVYAWQALMVQARNQADGGDYQAALATLQKAATMPIEDEGLKAITTLQIARVQLQNQDSKGALDTLNASLPEAFEASRQEILGDVYVTTNQTDEAKAAYQKAWDILNARHENRSLLRLKMQALGQNVPVIAEPQIVANTSVSAAAPTDDGTSASDAQVN